jgi:hypothetical protein
MTKDFANSERNYKDVSDMDVGDMPNIVENERVTRTVKHSLIVQIDRL